MEQTDLSSRSATQNINTKEPTGAITGFPTPDGQLNLSILLSVDSHAYNLRCQGTTSCRFKVIYPSFDIFDYYFFFFKEIKEHYDIMKASLIFMSSLKTVWK